MGELIKLYSKMIAHLVVGKIYVHFPSKVEDAGIHLLKTAINAKICAKIVGREDVENEADWIIDSMREELGI